MPDRDRITIDEAACNGDGACVAVCPAFVFQQAESASAPKIVRPEDCIRCGHCVAACPTEAVQVRGVKVKPFPDDGAEAPVAPDDLLALMQRRRSVRRMADEPVPKEAVKRIIEAASAAPTAKNARAIRITTIDDPDLRQALLGRCQIVYRSLARRLRSPLRRFMNRLSRKMPPEMLELAVRSFEGVATRLEAGEDVVLFDAPVTLVFSAPEGLGMGAYDCSYVIMNASLMAETLGLGTCIMGYFFNAAQRDAEMRRLMGLPDYEQVYGALTVGYPKHRMRRQIDRRRFRINRPQRSAE